GVIPPVSGNPIAIIPPKENVPLAEETRVYEDRFSDVVVRRECMSGSCQVSLRWADDGLPPDTRKWSSMGVNRDSPLPVRRDERQGIWVLGEGVAFRGRDFRRIASDGGPGADGWSPPLGWILGAGIGLLIAGVLTAQRRRVARRAAAIAGAVPGVHNQNGW